MLLQDCNAVIFGGSGAIGGAIARVMAREGARVFLGGRSPEKLRLVATDVRAAGGVAETFVFDALDERGTIDRVADISSRAGGIDIAVHATGFPHDQGTTLADLSLAEFMRGVDTFLPALFVTSKSVAPHMGKRRPGVILTVVPPAGRMALPGHLSHVVTCAAEEAFVRVLASELSAKNIRVICLKSHAISGAIANGSYTREIFATKADDAGLSVDDWLDGAAAGTMLGRLPTLSQVAETAAFMASRHASAMTATFINMTAGAVTD
jgi:NAD(P)-dependent dehydrogenase (short-subunit alcohol dehydrogenase family)